ncbi:MAG: EAL domain-containing protein [Lachnospiraceae bacterium]|nr:EAL domain-containing protein [Lachnospiraceae bacterium]
MVDKMEVFLNYTPVADILTATCCLTFILLIRSAYISKTRNFIYLKHMIYLLIIASISDINYGLMMQHLDTAPHVSIYIFRCIYHISIFSILWLYVAYIKENLQISYKYYKTFYIIAGIGYVLLFVNEILSIVLEYGFYIDEDNILQTGFPIIPFGYVFFMTLSVLMIFLHGKKIYKRVLFGLLSCIALSVIIICVQQFFGQSSFTAASFLLPIFARLYLIHANPYDIEMGAVSEKSFSDMVSFHHEKKIPMYIMSLYMHDFDGKGRKYPEKIQRIIRKFMSEYFIDPTLFHISGGHLILTVTKAKDSNYMENAQKMLSEFIQVYDNYKIDYKIVYTDSFEEISAANDYIGFIKYLHDKMAENSMIFANENDVQDYLNYKYILSELADINKAKDLKDERILVYCQPVFDLDTNRFDTAEALMRLKLPRLGIVPPNLFIPIAESNHYITTLTRTILFKTCQEIKKLNDQGYYVQRISVNFSIQDIQSDELFSSIEGIIKENGIAPEQLAIEITETQSESEFELIKQRISELKETGIKFYLDDFGTGYSNFERIMELPFDIVKFDRSLVIASGNNMKYRTMVSHLANMFNKLHYFVLFEGVENYDDEVRCISMNANYLQGYKYSKPIPIEQLDEYFVKDVVLSEKIKELIKI